MFRSYNPQSIVLAPRRLLPTGDCGFVVYADPLPPFVFNAAQSVRCQCRNFWPNPHTVDLCACGHHACYHSQEPTPPPTPSSPSTVLTIGAYASLMNRISRLEQEQDAQNAKKKKHETTAHQPELKGMMNGLRSLDHKMSELVERMEEAEERLFGAERQGMEVDSRLNELEVKSEELEEELDVLKDTFDEEDEEDEIRRAKQEENRMSGLKRLESRTEVPIEPPKEQPSSTPKQIKTEPPEVVNQDGSDTNTSTTVVLAQPPFLKTFSLKRRLSDSDLLEDRQPHPTERSRALTGSFSS